MKFIFASFLVVSTFVSHAHVVLSTNARDIMTNMLTAIGNTKGLKYTFKSYERLAGKPQLFFTEMDMKVHLSPLKVFGLQKTPPNENTQVLYVTGMWDGDAKVNPGGWIPTVSLSPLGSRMRENQHHTILQAGFNFLAQIIKSAISRAETERPGQFDSFFKYEGDITWNGRSCYKMVIEDPEFKYVDYTVQPGDDINKIEKARQICGYLIIEKNPSVKSWDSLKPGMKIKVPSSYAKKTILYIDKQNNLPIVQIMSDEVGEFEKYEFYNLVVNPAFAADEFSPDFKDYDF